MYRLMLCLGTDRAIKENWIMIAQFRTAKDVLDKRNRLIRKGNNPKDLLIIRLKGNT
tara:strand:- start:305 stop:475 length:171 start_codon:yes stop_codon:yes gene_type:complete